MESSPNVDLEALLQRLEAIKPLILEIHAALQAIAGHLGVEAVAAGEEK